MFIKYLIDIFIFIFGLCIGSFLNCYIYRRLPASAECYGQSEEKKISLEGRSFCPHCKHTLSWLDLFPVFSFLFLAGKCRYCQKKISWQYPLVEFATGLIFLLIFLTTTEPRLGVTIFQFLNLAFLFYVASALIIIFIYDLKHYLIPDRVLFPAIIVTVIYRLIENWGIGSFIVNWKLLLENYALAALIASGFFLLIFWVSRGRGMGFGDVKLAVLMGLLLGFPNILVALFIAFFFGAIIGLILMAFKEKSLKSEIPFGPFLITGTFLAMFYGQQIIQWYLNFFKI